MKGRTKLAGSDILGILDGWVGLGMGEDAALVLVLFQRTSVWSGGEGRIATYESTVLLLCWAYTTLPRMAATRKIDLIFAGWRRELQRPQAVPRYIYTSQTSNARSPG